MSLTVNYSVEDILERYRGKRDAGALAFEPLKYVQKNGAWYMRCCLGVQGDREYDGALVDVPKWVYDKFVEDWGVQPDMTGRDIEELLEERGAAAAQK